MQNVQGSAAAWRTLLLRHAAEVWSLLCAQANFDDVLVPLDHVSRSANDTFYVDSDTVLRCHTSAHQVGAA